MFLFREVIYTIFRGFIEKTCRPFVCICLFYACLSVCFICNVSRAAFLKIVLGLSTSLSVCLSDCLSICLLVCQPYCHFHHDSGLLKIENEEFQTG